MFIVMCFLQRADQSWFDTPMISLHKYVGVNQDWTALIKIWPVVIWHPYVLHAYVLHSYVLHPYVLHPYVLHPYVLHPYVFMQNMGVSN